jgi:hypothetical protein
MNGGIFTDMPRELAATILMVSAGLDTTRSWIQQALETLGAVYQWARCHILEEFIFDKHRHSWGFYSCGM